jgi:hypothetical protein
VRLPFFVDLSQCCFGFRLVYFDRNKIWRSHMFCSNCGKEIPADAHFCPACGHVVAPTESVSAASLPPPPPSPAPAPGQAATTVPAATAVPAKKKMALWKKISIGVVVFVVAAVALALWATSDLVPPIERQLDALKRGDMQAAYSETSTTFRDSVSLPQFQAFVRQHPGLSRNAGHSFSERSVDASGTGHVKGTLKDDRGGALPIEYQLIKENDQWKILGIKIPAGAN